MIEINDVKFNYTQNNEANLINIHNFYQSKGEKLFLFGPSGCGKTTFLEILSGVLSPDQGSVKINGVDLTKLSHTERDSFRADNIGYIFQNFNLIPYLSVIENITLPLYLSIQKRKLIPRNLEISEAKKIALSLGISDIIEKRVTELSLGQQQRVAVARAVIGKPKLILADEPTSSLDYDHREKFLTLLFKLCSEAETTLIFVSHDRALQSLFDRSISFHAINRVSPYV